DEAARSDGAGMTIPVAALVGDVGIWSGEKLDLLASYLGRPGSKKGFLPATAKAQQRYYIDLFAGPGQDRVRGNGEIIDGSPLIALKAGPPEFTELFLVDSRPTIVKALRARCAEFQGRRAHVRLGDANAVIDDILRVVPTQFPVFAFLDPR